MSRRLSRCPVVCHGRGRRVDICQGCRVVGPLPREWGDSTVHDRLTTGPSRRRACGEGQGLPAENAMPSRSRA